MISPASLLTRIVDRLYWRRLDGVISRQLFRYAFCGGLNLSLDAMWYYVIYHYLIGEERFINLGFVHMSAPIASLFLVFPITFFPLFSFQPIILSGKDPTAATFTIQTDGRNTPGTL